MLKIFVFQCHPRNIFNIELFPNYGTSISTEIPWKTSFGPLCLNILCKYMESHDRHGQQQHGPCAEQPCKDLLAVPCWVLVIHWVFLQLDVITMDAAGVVEGA